MTSSTATPPAPTAPVTPAEPSTSGVVRALQVFGRSFRTVWSNGKARVGLVILAVFVLVAIFAPVLAPYSPHANNFAPDIGSNSSHLLGTTGAGEDVLSQLLYGARVSILVGFVAGGISTLVAVAVGLSWGYLRNWVGEVVNFIVNLFLVVPGLPLMIIIAAYAQNGGLPVIVLVVVITGWAWGARVLRAQTQSLRSRDFVTAALFSGESATRVVFREILPNMTSMIAGSFFGAATAAVLAESGLSFLGLGDPFTVSWGSMLYWAQNSNALLTGQWILLFAPGLCVALLATAMTLVNFGVDGLSNPRLREGNGR
ncbi:ABC transporter permease [Actinacidiphila yeochonensis]|uniref:ABC transporter permease n=1 Tax=Actinacidiphila yeochonensis TaxID=89050 RepID=UPI0005677FCC|nr:ABC transporter permease [Actinacidiphila yeochonensis]